MREKLQRIRMHVVCMHIYSLFPLRSKKKKLLCLQTVYSVEKIAEMFDISKPRERSGNAKLAKLSRQRAAGGQAWPSLPSLPSSLAPLSTFPLPPALRAGAVEDPESALSRCHALRWWTPEAGRDLPGCELPSSVDSSAVRGVCAVGKLAFGLASYKRSGRGSCRGSQLPQGPFSWPVRAGHSGYTTVRAPVSVCVCFV